MKRFLLLALIPALFISLPAASQEAEGKEPVKPVLVVMDIQNKYIPMMDKGEQEPALRMINGAIWLFRDHKLPVIRVYHTDPKWGPEPGTEEFEFPESVNIQEDDQKIVKNFPSAFTKTELDTMLEEMGANTVFLCGLSATGCVLATYYGAMDRGYDVLMIEGALMSGDAEKTETIKDIVGSVGWSGLKLILRAVAQ